MQLQNCEIPINNRQHDEDGLLYLFRSNAAHYST